MLTCACLLGLAQGHLTSCALWYELLITKLDYFVENMGPCFTHTHTERSPLAGHNMTQGSSRSLPSHPLASANSNSRLPSHPAMSGGGRRFTGMTRPTRGYGHTEQDYEDDYDGDADYQGTSLMGSWTRHSYSKHLCHMCSVEISPCLICTWS